MVTQWFEEADLSDREILLLGKVKIWCQRSMCELVLKVNRCGWFQEISIYTMYSFVLKICKYVICNDASISDHPS